MVFGDIGFDKPGRFGLSFNHAILFFACYCCAAIALVYCVAVLRKRLYIALLVLSIIIHTLPIVYAELRTIPPKLPDLEESLMSD